METWKPRELDHDRPLYWRIGPLKLWVQRTADEWMVAVDREPEDENGLQVAEAVAKPEELEWNRWAALGDSQLVRLLPVTPDRPVVVRPESPVKFPPQAEALFYARIPLWVRVVVGTEGEVVLCEEPSLILSNSWFGDPMRGELCYSMRTSARRSLAGLPARPHRAVCPILISNRAQDQLDFERICLRVNHLNIYGSDSGLWTSEAKVTFRGEDQESRIDLEDQPPRTPDSPAALALLTKARDPARQSVFSRSFMSLKRFSL